MKTCAWANGFFSGADGRASSFKPGSLPSGRKGASMSFWRSAAKARDALAQADAIGKSQSVIEFNMDGTIVTANENFLDAMGYTLSEIVGKRHAMFVEPGLRDSGEYRAFWADLNLGKYRSGEFKRIGKGGREVWIQASYNPILDLNGKPFKVVKYATDTTAQVIARKKSDSVRGMMETVAAGAEELNASVREISETMTKSRQTASEAVVRVGGGSTGATSERSER